MSEKDAIICRSLWEVDALVAMKLMGLKPSSRPDVIFTPPHYTTWPGLEPVIQWVIAQGFTYTLERQLDNSCWLGGVCRATINTGPGRYRTGHGETESIAFCLAALASAGFWVKLELGD